MARAPSHPRLPALLLSLLLLAGALALLAVGLLAGCEPAPPEPTAVESAPRPAPVPDRWHALEPGADDVAALDDELAAVVAEASAEARRTAGAARERWGRGDPAERRRWHVKWAAPTTDGGVEHVWVQPATWTAFRVEGTLESAPSRPLVSGRSAGDLVGFPTDELSDWVRTADDGSVEGGFTIAALEQRLGG